MNSPYVPQEQSANVSDQINVEGKRKLKAVLDTNVLLGIDRRQLLRYAAGGVYEFIWSDYIRAELTRKTVEMGWRPEKAKQLLTLVQICAISVDYTMITGGNYDEWLKDLDDHPIMATALAGKVDYLVTQNTKDFPPKKRFAGITIITPDAFLRLLRRNTK